jgi:hypothetical protein
MKWNNARIAFEKACNYISQEFDIPEDFGFMIGKYLIFRWPSG